MSQSGLNQTCAMHQKLKMFFQLGDLQSAALCMYRLLFARDFFACLWKSLICIRPIDRHAGRGLVGAVISLPARSILTDWAVRFWGRNVSVPCSLSIANFFEVVGVIFKYQLRPHFLAHQTPFCV